MKKIAIIIKSTALLFCFLSFQSAFARPTGSFDASISFMGGTRKLAFYVPANYDSTKKYNLMVCLHGLGDNIDNYRGAIVSYGWPATMPNTIFVCPEAVTTTADFYQPAGGEAIIPQTISYAGANYNIDASNIILQGFSLGGRAALRYGLDNPSVFKGLLLTTPAIQGVKEGLNLSDAKYTFNYANASKIPIYITHGLSDPNYEAPIDSMFLELVQHDGIAWKFEFPGMGHAIPPISKIKNFISLFNTPDTASYDLDIQSVIVPPRSCNSTVNTNVLIRNMGSKTITSATLTYSVNGTSQNYTWNGTLNPFQHALVQLPPFTASSGFQSIDVKVTSLNGSVTDEVASNNDRSASFEIVSKGISLPEISGFNGPLISSGGWLMNRSGDYISEWFLDSTVHKSGAASIGAFNTILVFNNAGRREEMLSPVLDLTTAKNPQIKFDVAYNYHHYTAAVLGVDSSFADTLQVLVSTDCGNTWKSVYKKGGKQLATFHNPILNPTTLQADFIVPADSNWRTEQIDLSNFGTATEAIVKFSYISALGGCIYLDNFRSAANLAIAEKHDVVAFKIYPNPATDQLNIIAGNENILKVNVMDFSGKTVMTIENETGANGVLSLNTSSLPKGLYLFEVYSNGGVKTERVMKL
jgi:hypothetical protein